MADNLNYKNTPFYSYIAANFTAAQLERAGITERHLANWALLLPSTLAEHSAGETPSSSGGAYNSVGSCSQYNGLPIYGNNDATTIPAGPRQPFVGREEEDIVERRETIKANEHSVRCVKTNDSYVDFELLGNVACLLDAEFAKSFQQRFNDEQKGLGLTEHTPVVAKIVKCGGLFDPKKAYLRVHCLPCQRDDVQYELLTYSALEALLRRKDEHGDLFNSGGYLARLPKSKRLSESICRLVPVTQKALTSLPGSYYVGGGTNVALDELNSDQQAFVHWLRENYGH